MALVRRLDEGGGWTAELSLARMAMWLHEMSDRLAPEPSPPAANASHADIAEMIVHMDSPFGRLGTLRPARALSLTPAALSPPVPLGSDPPVWATPSTGLPTRA